MTDITRIDQTHMRIMEESGDDFKALEMLEKSESENTK